MALYIFSSMKKYMWIVLFLFKATVYIISPGEITKNTIFLFFTGLHVTFLVTAESEQTDQAHIKSGSTF